MAYVAQLRIPATYMRGGTSKGLFFRLQDLPLSAQKPGVARDRLLLRVIGSPDPYGKQMDGMGGGSSSTSKTVILAPSSRHDHDVDYLFGQVVVDQAFIDWSGNCGNLSAAVGPFAIAQGWVDPVRVPRNGTATVRIWQANIGETIIAHVPMCAGQVQEDGDFMLDGVAFPAASLQLTFMEPSAGKDGIRKPLFPTGRLVDDLDVPGVGRLKASMIDAGIATLFVEASALGFTGTELQESINGDSRALAMFETIRAYGALCMGLIDSIEDIAKRPHTPKLAFIAGPTDYMTSRGQFVESTDIDLLVRAVSMGCLHHAMMGTVVVATGAAAAVPGTLVNLVAGGGGCGRVSLRIGHPSGTLQVRAEAVQRDEGSWCITKVSMYRSARVLMEGWVRIPAM